MAGGSRQIDLVGLKRQKTATKTIVADAAGTLTSVFRQLQFSAGSARAANPELQPLPSPLHRKRLHQISHVEMCRLLPARMASTMSGASKASLIIQHHERLVSELLEHQVECTTIAFGVQVDGSPWRGAPKRTRQQVP